MARSFLRLFAGKTSLHAGDETVARIINGADSYLNGVVYAQRLTAGEGRSKDRIMLPKPFPPRLCAYFRKLEDILFLSDEQGDHDMESATLIHMEPSLPMLAEAFPQGKLHCREPERSFRDIRLFNRDTRADPSVLYLVRPEDAAMFPGESCAGICQVPLKGDCLVLPRMEIADIFNAAMTIYDRCRWKRICLRRCLPCGITISSTAPPILRPCGCICSASGIFPKPARR